MMDDPRVVAAAIAAIVSLVVSAGTIWATRFRASTEREKQERELERKLTERLYEERITHYRKAFSITQGLGYVVQNEDFRAEEADAIYRELSSWLASDAAFVVSRRSLSAYYDIRDALKVTPDEQGRYSMEQRRGMWKAKNEFRSALRNDVRLLFLEDEEESDA